MYVPLWRERPCLRIVSLPLWLCDGEIFEPRGIGKASMHKSPSDTQEALDRNTDSATYDIALHKELDTWEAERERENACWGSCWFEL